MAILDSKFDILRGYPNGSASVWTFDIKQTGSPLAPVLLPGGTLVTQELQGTLTVVDKATTPDISTLDPLEVWLVVEGNDDYSGEFTKKVACAKPGTGLIWETDDFGAGTWTPGKAVTYSAGQAILRTAVTQQVLGHVLEDRSATKGTVVISA
jgi:hypothetical protein